LTLQLTRMSFLMLRTIGRYFQLIEIAKKESYIFVPLQLMPPFTCKIQKSKR